MSSLRIIIINGTKLVQKKESKQWKNISVNNADYLNPGIYYPINPKPNGSYLGHIVFVNSIAVYQLLEGKLFNHNIHLFSHIPNVGEQLVKIIYQSKIAGNVLVEYENEKETLF